MGITILIKIQTDQLNETEKTQTTPDTPDNHPLPQNPTTETSHLTKKDTPKCSHYFGYVSSGEKIPEDCLTCSKLLKCLTSKGDIQEEE